MTEYPDHYPNGPHEDPLHGSDTCLETGQTFDELDYFNIAIDGGEDWQPFFSESAWMDYMSRLEVSR